MKTKFKIILALTLIIGLVLWAGWYICNSGAFRLNLTVPVVGVVSPPCVDNPASSVELGSPYRTNPTAEFTTSGGTIYVTARRFDHGGLFGSFRGSTAINVGDVAMPPTYNERSGIISNTVEAISVTEGAYGELKLPAGRYWLWSSTGTDILLISCDPNGVSDPKPVSGPEKLKNVNEN